MSPLIENSHILAVLCHVIGMKYLNWFYCVERVELAKCKHCLSFTQAQELELRNRNVISQL